MLLLAALLYLITTHPRRFLTCAAHADYARANAIMLLLAALRKCQPSLYSHLASTSWSHLHLGPRQRRRRRTTPGPFRRRCTYLMVPRRPFRRAGLGCSLAPNTHLPPSCRESNRFFAVKSNCYFCSVCCCSFILLGHIAVICFAFNIGVYLFLFLLAEVQTNYLYRRTRILYHHNHRHLILVVLPHTHITAFYLQSKGMILHTYILKH
ncbi:hypothetical protein C8F01DRAFT_720851 [Mycena amicta]|nr:hypothetical protein C8F01DRAFT_720851 [Mycena amicta]